MERVQAYEASDGSLHKTLKSAARASIAELVDESFQLSETYIRDQVADFLIAHALEIQSILGELESESLPLPWLDGVAEPNTNTSAEES